MTRRGLREQVFKMLFRVEFHNVEDMPEQMNMFEEVEECSEKDKEYISNKFHNIVEKRSMQRSMRFPRDGRPEEWEK